MREGRRGHLFKTVRRMADANSCVSLTPRYTFTLHTLAAPPAITSVVAMLKALREYRTPLKLSSLGASDGSSEDPRNGAPAFADGVPVTDVGDICVDAIRGDDACLTGGGEIK